MTPTFLQDVHQTLAGRWLETLSAADRETLAAMLAANDREVARDWAEDHGGSRWHIDYLTTTDTGRDSDDTERLRERS